jgi:prophage regulatory protein
MSMITAPKIEESLKILRLPQVCEITGLCRSMIYQLEADLRFPQRVKIGIRAVGWLDNEVHAWLIRRIAISRTKSSP